jgi:hypothetical protein
MRQLPVPRESFQPPVYMEGKGELMERYSLRDAQDHFQKLIDDAQRGKTVLILDEHERAVQHRFTIKEKLDIIERVHIIELGRQCTKG